MFWTWGAYTFPQNENWFDIDARFVTSPVGRRTHSHVVVDLYGVRYAASKADLTTQLGDLEDNLASDGKDLIFKDDDGTPTRHSYLNSSTINGVMVTGLWYLRRRSAGITGGTDEYVARRTYRIRFEFDVLNSEQNVLVWRESLVRRGTGGPRFVLMGALVGPLQKQFTQQFTPYTVIQSGFAVGHLSTPIPATPIWPADLLAEEPEIEIGTPQFGRVLNTGFPVRWKYVYQSAVALTGGPTLF